MKTSVYLQAFFNDWILTYKQVFTLTCLYAICNVPYNRPEIYRGWRGLKSVR